MLRLALPVLLLLLATLPARAEVPGVVTDIAPVQSLVQQVMGDLGQPVLLLEQGADPHAYQLRPSQAAALQTAGLVVWIGPAMSPWLARLVPDPGAEASLALLDVPGTERRDFSPDQEGGTDPHAWLDPGNAAIWLRAIADRLASIDPGNAAAYRANAAAAEQEIAALALRLSARLQPARDVPLVFSHDAYGYFVDHFGLTLGGSLAAGDAAPPGAARLSGLRASLVPGACIFPETLNDPKAITVLAEGTPARLGAPLDPEGRGITPGPGLYAALMTALAQSIADCAAGQ